MFYKAQTPQVQACEALCNSQILIVIQYDWRQRFTQACKISSGGELKASSGSSFKRFLENTLFGLLFSTEQRAIVWPSNL